MKSFVGLVVRKMDQKKISLRKVAREIGVDPSFFSKVLAGKRSPPSDEKVLRKLAKLLELDPLFLIISTGMIPADLQEIMERPQFLKSLRNENEFAASRGDEGPLTLSLPKARDSERRRTLPSRSVFVPIRKSPDLSEDLL